MFERVETISRTSGEQGQGVKSLSGAFEVLGASVRQNTASAGEEAEAARHLEASTETLLELAVNLGVLMEGTPAAA
jgi:methyl-accepting chemotaxis protein